MLFQVSNKIPLYFTIPINQSVQWNIIRDLNITHLLFTQARCFWVVIWLDCSLLPNGGTSDFRWIFFWRLEIPTKTLILRGASILGKGQDSYLKLYCRLFHKLTSNLRDCCLDQPGYHEEFSLGILQHKLSWK